MPATTHTFPHGAQAWTDATGTGGQRGYGSGSRGRGIARTSRRSSGYRGTPIISAARGARVVRWRVESRGATVAVPRAGGRVAHAARRTPTRDAQPARFAPVARNVAIAVSRARGVKCEHLSGARATSILVVYFTSSRRSRSRRVASSPPPFRDAITRAVCLLPPPPLPSRSPVGVPRRPTPAGSPVPSSYRSRATPSSSPPP